MGVVVMVMCVLYRCTVYTVCMCVCAYVYIMCVYYACVRMCVLCVRAVCGTWQCERVVGGQSDGNAHAGILEGVVRHHSARCHAAGNTEAGNKNSNNNNNINNSNKNNINSNRHQQE